MAVVFLVPGEQDNVAAGGALRGLDGAAVVQAVRVSQRRDAGQAIPVAAQPGEDVVVVQVANGPELVLHPETARDLFEAQAGATRSAGTSGAQVAVPARLRWPQVGARGAQYRGGEVLIAGFQVLKAAAVDATAEKIVQKFDDGVTAGVHKLDRARLLAAGTGTPLEGVPPAKGGRPILVLVHGTFSSTEGTFKGLWTNHVGLVNAMFDAYADQVYALEHATLGKTPAENALELAGTLPDGAVLHVLTHSRGGLVAEVMARACDPQQADEPDLSVLAADPRSADAVRKLFAIVRQRGIRVARIVRVACPARGTLLASRRLDAYISVVRWAMQAAKVPILPQLVDFLGDVARKRLDPMMVPGLAAQVPDSALVQWLHKVPAPIPGQLRVIAGDVAGDSLASWLKTLVSDSFFWTDNDFVVQTRSMYGGAPRAAEAAFVLDAGGDVSHFGYFGNEKTARAAIEALTQESPDGFQAIGPLSWAGQVSTGVRAATEPATRGPQTDKPALLLLPGIVGSNLKANGKRVWLSWRLVNGFMQLRYVQGDASVQPDGVMDSTYEGLMRFLSQTHELIAFDFDWRLPIEQEARRLAQKVMTAVRARSASGQPVRMVAHSMGGLVARVMQIECPAEWDAWMSLAGARLLMLGTPNEGSWAPMQVLSGDDTFGNALLAFGAPFQDHQGRTTMAGFPGLLQLQAGLTHAEHKLNEAGTWEHLAREDLDRARRASAWHFIDQQLSVYRWGVPTQAVLDAAVALRGALDKQRDQVLARYADRVCMVLGTAPRTPDGYAMGEAGLEYLDLVGSGDGRVTDRNAMLAGVPAWRAPAVHGSLPGCQEAWPAYLELLESGRTQLLPAVAGTTRGGLAPPLDIAPRHERSRPARSNPGTPPRAPDPLLPPPGPTDRSEGSALRISLLNSDLSFIDEPLLVGHYASLALTGSEGVVNRLLGGKLQRAMAAGDYPQDPGVVKVFRNTRLREDPWQMPRPEAVVVVGLGPEGTMQPERLSKAVANGVVTWALGWDDSAEPPLELQVAATLIGSGGVNISAGQAAQRIAQGVRDANERLRAVAAASDGGARRLPLVTRLLLVDLYLDRATEAWRALKQMQAASPGEFALDEKIETEPSGMERPLESSYRGADFDLIVATWRKTGSETEIQYRLDTRRARTEVQVRATQSALLEQLLRDDAREVGARKLGSTLFQLLVPLELATYLASSGDTQFELDKDTAGIPWELLELPQDGNPVQRREPWSIRTKLLRKLQTADFHFQTHDADPSAGILILGEPACPSNYARLPGARAEARAVLATMQGAGFLGRLKPLIARDSESTLGPDARTVVEALLEQPWRVVHISGHGVEPKGKDPRGVVLSGDVFLGPREVKGMAVVPELVFVNCCFSGKMGPPPSGLEPVPPLRRPTFAANLAAELINIGVRCVIATGWAVADDVAERFASVFYAALVRGARFIDAVAEARRAAHAMGGDTWGAYQCYGDPDWRLRIGVTDAQRPPSSLTAGVASVASLSGLLLALRSIAVQAAFHGEDKAAAKAALANLEQRFASTWGRRGSVAEAFGLAWDACGETDTALRWLRAAAEAKDGGASFVAAEKLHNLGARFAWESFEQEMARGAEVEPAVKRARERLEAARAGLLQLVAVAPTPERISLGGSVDKRLALLHARLGNVAGLEASIQSMRDQYQRAWDAMQGDTAGVYPAMNVLAASAALGAPASADVDGRVRKLITAKIDKEPDFECVAAAIEIEAWDALVRSTLGQRLVAIRKMFEDLHDRVPREQNWRSVRDQTQFIVDALRARGKLPQNDPHVMQLMRFLTGYAFPDRAQNTSKETSMANSRHGTSAAPQSSVELARGFIHDAALPEPRAKRRDGGTDAVMQALETTKQQAAIVGSEVVAFAEGVDARFRKDLVNSTLLAQLVANKQVPDRSRIFEWYDAYFDALANIGWSVQNRDFAIYAQHSQNLDIHKAIISILTTLLGPGTAGLAMVTGTLEALQSMDADNPFITLLARESMSARQAHFQVTAVSKGEDGEPTAKLAAFSLEAKSDMTQVLFFRWRTDRVTLRHSSSHVSIDTDVAAAVREPLRQKLAHHATDYVKALPDL